MTLPISIEQMARYRRTTHRRWQVEKERREHRRQRAWQLARQAAALLREKCAVERVVLFGSLAHPARFTQWSDVDLAAWGLSPLNWLQAIGDVRALSEEVDLNLVDAGSCPEELLTIIEKVWCCDPALSPARRAIEIRVGCPGKSGSVCRNRSVPGDAATPRSGILFGSRSARSARFLHRA